MANANRKVYATVEGPNDAAVFWTFVRPLHCGVDMFISGLSLSTEAFDRLPENLGPLFMGAEPGRYLVSHRNADGSYKGSVASEDGPGVFRIRLNTSFLPQDEEDPDLVLFPSGALGRVVLAHFL
jgi:hypothetical protein